MAYIFIQNMFLMLLQQGGDASNQIPMIILAAILKCSCIVFLNIINNKDIALSSLETPNTVTAFYST